MPGKSVKKATLTIADANVIVKPGDVWLLNQHRIMCGDSTDIIQVKQLMLDEKADMAFIDPPYNVNYQGCKKIRQKIKNDHLQKNEFIQFLTHLVNAHQVALKRGGSLYMCYSNNHHRLFQQALEENDFEIRTQIVWSKNHFVLSFARYKLKHEVIFYCHRKKEKDPWYGDNKQTTVWQIPKPAANKLHPTMKPIALIEKALLNSSKKEDIIIDLCGGAGSTLMACENLGRYARLMEIEPHYVDATIQRWQAQTKQHAVLLSKQLTYNELQTQRS